mgnify:CR=1 FL=1
MKISTKGRYALRLMVDLAQCKQGENVALKEVAARQGISLKYLEQIITLQRQVMCSAQEVQTEDIVLLMNPNIIPSV